jgi:sec-independent protein translocase protein TatC
MMKNRGILMGDPERNLTLGGHIEELRKRLLYALIALGVGTLISFAFAENIISFISIPIGGVENLQSIEITENLGVFMRVSLLCGFVLALPVILYELLAFILPGLHPKERRWVFWTIPAVTLMFLFGAAFAFYVMLPTAIPFLIGFLGVPTVPRLSNYISFVTRLMFWIGISFQAPLVVFFLAKLKLVDAKTLAKQWRLAFIVIAIIAAMVTPTVDPVNMTLLMLPLILLYWISVLLAFIARRSD